MTLARTKTPVDLSAWQTDPTGFLDLNALINSNAVDWAAAASSHDPQLPMGSDGRIGNSGLLFHHGHGEPGVGATRGTGAGSASHDDPGAGVDRAEAVIEATAIANAPTVVYSISQIATYLTQGYWLDDGQQPHKFGSGTITYNINGLSTAEKALATQALQAWADVANLKFSATTGSAQITFNDGGSGVSAFTPAKWSGGLTISADITITKGWFNTYGTQTDSSSYEAMIHEIGHALGLGHGGPYNGSGTYSSDAIYANDTVQYSIMSYFEQSNFGGASDRHALTPQIADIAAVVSLYGLATTTRTGATVYGFHNNGGSIYDFSSYGAAPALTVFDSGGSDTLDCSGYSTKQTLDLTAGNFCSIGGLINNIGIAFGTTIENAVGGSGSDTIIGNSADNRIDGGAGADQLTGGSGDDVFVYATSGGADTITDFTAGASSIDKIDLSVFAAITDFAEVLARATQSGANTVINFGDSNTLTLLQINQADLSSHDFVFAGAAATSGQTIIGTNGTDNLLGSSGGDRITGEVGNDKIDGGAGRDTAVYVGALNQYLVNRNGASVTVADSVSSRDGTDTLASVEHLRFADRSVDLTIQAKTATISESQRDSLIELYVGYFNRVPGASGLNYWIDKLKGGESLNDISKEFYAAGVQYSAITSYSATMSNADFIKIVFANTLGRTGANVPSDSEVQYWDNQITSGVITKEGLIQQVLHDAHLFANDPTWGWVPKLLDHKIELGNYHAIQLGIDYNSPNEEIATTVVLASAVTSSSTNNAVSLIGLVDHVFI